MKLRTRLNRLESHRGIQHQAPTVARIIISRARREDGEIAAEASAAMVWTPSGWKTITREEDEVETAFVARVDALDASQS